MRWMARTPARQPSPATRNFRSISIPIAGSRDLRVLRQLACGEPSPPFARPQPEEFRAELERFGLELLLHLARRFAEDGVLAPLRPGREEGAEDGLVVMFAKQR